MQVAQVNMVHESESQRRHARVRIPCKLHLANSDIPYAFELLDLSASGFAVRDNHDSFKRGDNSAGHLKFNFDGLEISLAVRFQVVSKEGEDLARVGCEFHDLGVKETSTLRMIITKFLSGEVTAAGDVINTLQRDNFSKPRKHSGSQPLTPMARAKALIGTSLVLAIGLGATAYIASNLYSSFFVRNAVAAAVSIPSYSAVTPREGFITALVSEGDRVSMGQPIATVDSPLLDVLQPAAQAVGIKQEELETMLASRVGSVIESPCDCTVVSNLVDNGEYKVKGDTALKLAQIDATTEVKARFKFEDLESLAIGKQANIKFSDSAQTMRGQITSIKLPQDIEDQARDLGSVLVTIQPEQPIDKSLINLPVSVSVSDVL
ncbi:PilZ domain-containing protein [Aestuariibacter sp. AA17]|uniref:PilZ domain-containing protein n=1 Tax=Fluctibacter corallii TaxID=2984329 RepID=A0ABT3A9B5_9ALTE|nr:PilZ domain-containing protein [Aestuariibacter sp. AA17]MCV2884911.1 PilZ domain-containing protein [Aestuariibacter sp. AA17]